ncbi:tetratricopeptide repeat protein [Actinosynnema sp. NPDC020468]|uniref:ATP-binding protein n=1 Tax=Actinosynnema sp. NPDC020468 TaxID=3154488 RepID=UPI0033EE536D
MTSVEVSGTADNVVQARDVNGGVHFHRVGPARHSVPRQLLADVRGFVNRSKELDWLDRVLFGEGPDAAALTVIVGTAGVGKTGLALRWAHRVRDLFPDGQLYANLRGYGPGEPVPPERALDGFLSAFDVAAYRIPSDLEAKATLYRSVLADRRVLVVLDNAATVAQVRPLLPGSGSCRVVLTSRNRLSGLRVRDGAQRMTVEVLPENHAVELLRSIVKDYRPIDDEADLRELARMCAYLPLALCVAGEQAAARPWMSLAQLVESLRQEFQGWDALATEGGDEADGVRAVFSWSYRALAPDAAQIFRLLGLHPAPEFGIHAAAALTDMPVSALRRLMDVIVDAHLVEQTAPDRYQFHDLLRLYATDAAHHEEPLEHQYEALARVLAWYLHTSHSAAIAMRTFHSLLTPDALPRPAAALNFADYLSGSRWYEFEWANLVAATKAAEKSGMDRTAWQLALMLRPYFTGRVSIADRHQIIEIAIVAARRNSAVGAEREALTAMATWHSMQGRYSEALTIHQDVLAQYHADGDRVAEGRTLNRIGIILAATRDFVGAVELFESLREIGLAHQDVEMAATVLYNLAAAYYGLRRHANAIDVAREALALCRDNDDEDGQAVSLTMLARSLCDSGAVSDALTSVAAALDIVRNRNDQREEGWVLLHQGRIQRIAGLYAQAMISYQRALTIHVAFESRNREAMALDGAGEVCRAVERFDDAISFHRRAVSLARETNSQWTLAVALDNLATVLAGVGAASEARRHWRESVGLLRAYRDPAASERKARMARLLNRK